jgi:enterochelin esterase family protein
MESTTPRMLAAIVAVVAAAAQAVSAQRPAAPVVSPELQPDRKVTFRLRAPAAKEVSVWGDWGPAVPLARADDGVWSVTLGPLAPELYQYGFIVDGLRITDPGNPHTKPQRSPSTSILEVPGQPALLSEFQPVPHGTLHHHAYQSRPLGRVRPLVVYTPPGYDQQASGRFPVLYLFHGSGDSEATWGVVGRAHYILDNLIHAGRAKPMVIVMPDGHAVPPGPAGGQNLEQFERDLLEEVIPFAEAHYRIRNTPDGRAIVGLSMGGGQSLTIGLNHTELFAWVGGFSSAVRDPAVSLAPALADPAATNGKLKLLWFACGKDDRLVDGARVLDTLLKEKSIRHEYQETAGGHSWPVWRKYLPQFVSLLFQ